jgi:predicted dehydrogenase
VRVDKLRWGVLSTSSFARRVWIPSAQQCHWAEVTAIASRDQGAADEVAKALGIPVAHGSYEALLADPDLDAVYIPLPNHLHAAWTIAASEAGKHVLCEKPLALTASEGETMAAAAERAGVALMEGFMYRFHPGWHVLRELVHAGRIGEPRAITTWFSYHNDDETNIRNIAEVGGGALNDIGCYPISAARWLFDAEPERVTGAIHRDARLGVDTMVAGVLEFPGGRIATIGSSTRAEPDQWFHVYGTDGRASISIPWNVPLDLPIEIRVTHGGDPPVAPAVEVIEVPAANMYSRMTDAFSRAVLDGAAVPTPVSDALANLRAMEALVAATRS